MRDEGVGWPDKDGPSMKAGAVGGTWSGGEPGGWGKGKEEVLTPMVIPLF